MHKTVKLTDSEWKIMQVLWRKSPRTLREIQDALADSTGWSKHTVISFLKRLLSKEAIAVEEAQPVRLYSPLLTEDAAVQDETQRMLGKLYGGDAGLMVLNLVRQQPLRDEDVDALLDILSQSKGGKDHE